MPYGHGNGGLLIRPYGVASGGREAAEAALEEHEGVPVPVGVRLPYAADREVVVARGVDRLEDAVDPGRHPVEPRGSGAGRGPRRTNGQPNGRTNGRTNTPSRDRCSVARSVTRALDVLDLLRTADGSLSAAEIAERADLDRTVVYRLLRTVADGGMVGERSGRFTPGPAVVLLSVVIERMWTAATPLGLALDLGDLDALDRTAAGRGMLAYRGEPELGHLPGDDRDDLAPILEEIRAAGGVALVDGSTTFGLQAVACAIRGAGGGASAAIGVAGVDLGDELAPDSSLASRLRHAAEAISRMLR